MAKDVHVMYVGGIRAMTYPKVDRIIEGEHVIRLEANGFNDETYKHIVSIPYTAIMSWREEEVDACAFVGVSGDSTGAAIYAVTVPGHDQPMPRDT